MNIKKYDLEILNKKSSVFDLVGEIETYSFSTVNELKEILRKNKKSDHAYCIKFKNERIMIDVENDNQPEDLIVSIFESYASDNG